MPSDGGVLPMLGMFIALHALISEQPPPLWRERCVAWKDARKDDCNRCCAAFGKNYFTPKAIVCVLLFVQFARLCMAGCCYRTTTTKAESPTQRLKNILGGAIRMAALSLPALMYAPTGQRMVWGGVPLVGGIAFAASYACLVGEALVLRQSLSYRRRRNRELLNLCCWAGAAAVAMAPRPHRYDALDVNPRLSMTMSATKSLISAGFSLVVAVSLAVVMVCRSEGDQTSPITKDPMKED